MQQLLNPRVISGIFIGLLVCFAAWLGGWLWAGFAYAVFWVNYRELLQMMKAKGIRPSRLVVIAFSSLFYVFAFIGWQRHFDVLITLGLVITFGWIVCRPKLSSMSDIGSTMLMLFYLGFLPSHFVLLRAAQDFGPIWHYPLLLEWGNGAELLFLVLFAVSATDIGAYYGGQLFGKKLLSPHISPAKTVEGSVVGTLCAAGVSCCFISAMHWPWYHGIILGILIAVTAQMGDLSESLFKRDAGVKDSGNLIPGHGGLLDRIDSYILSGAVAYYYTNWFIWHRGIAHDILQWFSS